MKKFRFTADIEFDAENAAGAFLKLVMHFAGLAADFALDEPQPEHEPWFTGQMELRPK